MQTAGTFSQDTPNADAEIFIGPQEFIQGAGTAAAAALTGITGTGGTANIISVASTSTGLSSRAITISRLVLRTGVFAPSTPQTLSGQAFGTAAAVPGPSAVAGTSGPSGFGVNQVIPPVLKANLPTLIGSVAGAKAKGIQINWVDVFFAATGVVTSVSVVLRRLIAAPGVAAIPIVIVDMNLVVAVGPLTATTANQVARVRSVNPSPLMITGDATLIDLEYNYTIAAGVFTSYGVVLGCSYNFN
jgi:hypothetical protein